ncbi:hypothetical protein [Idiomarina xiamenensis]|uniref:Tail spike TSP1/Gp66 N-terminal domain-containing protein n=1 Tax=Idiomarina xiamenensis 10-D-4 TaxID=740709 RepID=K2KQH3_9GAMM|nr:hypothetical protein [Idiomarina xiamenensis]EKE84694.1 hypothetical protein A10D4_03750 [Idiomarina xiamenensis 10-D-4]
METSQVLTNADLDLATLARVVTSNDASVLDRLGQPRLTLSEIQRRSEAAINSLKTVSAGNFSIGFTINSRNEVAYLADELTYYRWDGALPKNVPASSTPSETGGVGDGAWIDVGQAAIRSDLANTSAGFGASLVALSLDNVLNPDVFSAVDYINTKQFYLESDGKDIRPSIQRAIDVVELMGLRRGLKISNPTLEDSVLKIQSLYDGELPALAEGRSVGIMIKRPDLVVIDWQHNTLAVDETVAELAAMDEVVSVCPVSIGAKAFLHMCNGRISGGRWDAHGDRPTNVIKADYRNMSYSMWSEMQLEHAREDVLRFSGFVARFEKVRCRYAGELHSCFNFTAEAEDGDSAARTGLLLDTCSADYAGLHGFSVSGNSGHTYCTLINCHADFIGRDDSNNTYASTLGSSYAYNIENVRGFKAIGLGVEFCTRALRAHNARTASFDVIYTLGLGHSDGSTEIDHAITYSGFFESGNLSNFELRNPSSAFTKRIKVSTPSQYNANSLKVDKTIPRSEISYNISRRTSANALIKTDEDDYRSGAKYLGGGKIVGRPYDQQDEGNWFEPASQMPCNSVLFRTSSSSVTEPLLTITDNSKDAALAIEIDIVQVSAIGAAEPTKFLALIGVDEGGFRPAVMQKILGGNPTAPSLAWSGSTLELTMPTTYSGYRVEVKTHQRAGTNNTGIRFKWDFDNI